MALAALDHVKTHDEAMQRFQAFLDDRGTLLLSADTKRVKNGNFYALFPSSYEPWQKV